MKKLITLTLFCLITTVTSVAQQPNQKMVKEMTHTIAALIEKNYVLKEKGVLIAAHFKNALKKGRFYQAQSLKQLDSIMTKSLREASNDYHLYTWNNKEIVNELKSEQDEGGETSAGTFFDNKKAYDTNFGFDKVDVLSDNIGYIKLSQINISDHSLKKLYAAMTLVENTNALIIDLRNNGGGGSTVGSVLETYFFNEHLDLLEFRKRNGQTEINSTVGWLLEKRYLKPLYILINKGTASAAEAFAFALKSQDRCVIIGEPSSGGAFMNTYFPVNEDFIVAISTAAPFLPGTAISWEGTGVQPDFVTDNPENALTRALEIIKSN